jgi:hypothetical protein
LIREAASYLVVVVLICEVSTSCRFLVFFLLATQIGLELCHADGVGDRRVGAIVVHQFLVVVKVEDQRPAYGLQVDAHRRS